MDSGAHFHKCDLQVHTPRDREWCGPRPVTADERQKYAKRFVAACRGKGLQALAITDHHDVAFFPYIKEAAEDERDSAGNPVPEAERLVVFPGMELTLGVPCQVLLILDSQFPASLLAEVPRVLGITPAHANEAQHAEVDQLTDLRDVNALVELLERQDFLQGRYIVLPNVSDSGHKTLLRKGFKSHYQNMPCVGGYVDGSVASIGEGVRRIVDGEDGNYGHRRIGVFQTSDSRSDDFAQLGEHSTWIKWAEPTAEALRQACLARETRIAHSSPELPPVFIRRLRISNSKFLGPVNVELNRQFNCLIGGRGTGKSSLLEYLRWALCDQPPDLSAEDELPDFQSKRAQLIAKTLKQFEATVTVDFELNGVMHSVRRHAKPHQLKVKIAEEEYRECDEQEIRDLLAVQAYSQKQLSSVGVRTDELLRLVRSPIKSQLAEIRRRERVCLDELRTVAEARYSKRALERALRRDETERMSIETQLKSLRESVRGLSDADQAVLNEHPAYESEREFVEGLDSRRERLETAVADLSREVELAACPQFQLGDEASPNQERVRELRAAYEAIRSELVTTTEHMQSLLSDGDLYQRFAELRDAWQQLASQHDASYEQAKARSASQQSTLDQITAAEERLRLLNANLTRDRGEYDRLGDPDARYAELATQWKAICDEVAGVVSAQCDSLTELSDRRIRATLVRGADTTRISDQLLRLIAGTRIRSKKVDDLCAYIAASDDPLDAWCGATDELSRLVDLGSDTITEAELPETPTLNRVGLTAADLLKLAKKLTVDYWVSMALTGVDDVPCFEYLQSEGDFIPFENASAGQQATALLRVLLKQAGPPLVIDQPEEDLDNQVVLQIVESIWGAKSRRQLLFSSHNANVVVNGDADLVVVCEYRVAGDQSAGQIERAGAIDVKDIRDAITGIMEGGEDAFRLRKEKYGF